MAKLCIALGLCAAAAFFSLSQFAVPRDREENKRQLSSLLSRFAVSQKVKDWALRSPLFQPQQDDPGATSFLSQLAEHPKEWEDPDATTLPELDWFSTVTQQLRTHETTSTYAADVSSRVEEHKPETSTPVITYAEAVASQSMEEGTQQQPSLNLVNIHPSEGMTVVRDLHLDETTERAVQVTTTHQSSSKHSINESGYGGKISTPPSPSLDHEQNATKVYNLSSIFAPENPELSPSLNKDSSVTQTSSLRRDGTQDAIAVSMSSSALATERSDADGTITEPSVAQRPSLAQEHEQDTTGSSVSSVFVSEQPELDTTHNTEPSLAQKSSLVRDNEQATTFSNLASVTTLQLDDRLNTERSSGQEALLAHDQRQDITAVPNLSSVYTSEQPERDVTFNTEPSIAKMTSSFHDQQETTKFSNFSSVYGLATHEPDTNLATEPSENQETANTTMGPKGPEKVGETAYVTTTPSASNTASRQEDDYIDTKTPLSSLPYQETLGITTSTASTQFTSDSHEEFTTTTEAVIEEPAGPKVVCYFTSWSLYRNGSGRFTPENIDAKLCTHIIYAFASLNSSTLKIIMADPWADADNELYKRATALKAANRRLRVLLSLGGWGDSGGSDDKYSRLAANATARRDFARDAATFLKKYRFDGLDIDWEYPNCASGVCSSNPPDVENFALLLKDLREAFDAFNPPLLLTAALSGNIEVIEEAYNVPEIFRQVDFASVMAYDYYGPWSSTTGHYAPFQAAVDETNPEISIEYVVNALLAMGAPASQLVLGVPFYARSFTLANPRKNTIGAPISGAGKPGPVTDIVGLLAYYEICSAIKAGGWTTMMDPDAGVYAYSADQWVCFDGPRSIMRKARFAQQRGLAGLMAWDLSMDDFLGVCGRANPLLNAARRVLYPPASKAAAASSG